MFNSIKKFNYYIRWGIGCKFLNKKIPLTCSLILTDKCNLNCSHCIVKGLGYKDLTFEEIKRDIRTLYNTGCRMLVVTGGEPFLWKDGFRNLDDVINFAKSMGFFRTVVCTNGTFKLESSSDYLWVSLDGNRDEHNRLRNVDIYNKVVINITNSIHNKIYINFAISRINVQNFEKSALEILKFKKVKGILFHLYTPYLGLEGSSLQLSDSERELAIKKIFTLKKKNPIKVSNTFSGIRALKTNKWQRPIWGSVVINDGEISDCCCRKGIYDRKVCENCGCTPAVETWVLQKINLFAVIENIRFL
jgi:MoaA/NifB/PqqE/SkfB family radical SAM enzyme